ncbi:hypothetical protein MKL37_17795 [Acinetobacter sp. AOR11_HL]|uniref:hypothetical protein n=1 Tax=Acinetobacter sp. AOR11_HL TaxID=2919377 RepID=UPI0022EA6C17|nr:hypothetical protein [Acinetobacter sp. AOR11_HL]MDA3552203.1 hypothetical protein [Acinetobacter sp. AOR11_HL]
MTDLNKGREAFELFELNKRPCATPASLFERFDSNDLGEDEQHYVGRYVDSYMQEKWELWQKAKAQAVPEKKIYLTCEQLYAAANFGAPNKDPELLETELTIAWFDEAHSGSGYYVYISEYPEEGAMKLESESGAEK